MRSDRSPNPMLLEPRSRSLWTTDELDREAHEERQLRRSMHNVLAVGSLVLLGLVLTTLVGEALEYRHSPFEPVASAPVRPV